MLYGEGRFQVTPRAQSQTMTGTWVAIPIFCKSTQQPNNDEGQAIDYLGKQAESKTTTLTYTVHKTHRVDNV